MPLRRFAAALALLALAGCGGTAPTTPSLSEVVPASAAVAASYARVEAALDRFLGACRLGACAVPVGSGVEVDTVLVADGAVEVRFSQDLGDVPFRPASADGFTRDVQTALVRVLGRVPVRVVTRGSAVHDLVPNYARAAADRDPERLFAPPAPGPALVRPDGPVPAPEAGLAGRHVALWPSHGWYYNPDLDTWTWQRARLFTTIEDLFTVDLVVDELTPMLERAGAVVLLPRERDTNPREVILDDASRTYAEAGAWADGPAGFGLREVYRGDENPFRLGGSRVASDPGASATWTAGLVEAGRYAVHVSYAAAPDRSEAARYVVRHAGGEATFRVNQRIGGGTWVYLGTFDFAAGASASVTLHGGDGAVSADAVRFGGGVGIVERGGATGGRPRWTEAARYYEQFAGAPPIVYNTTGTPADDYTDDYRSRGEWVNWLRGAPYGPTNHRDAPGLGIPVDLSLAWHTDAGIDRDETIGTLLIYNVPGMDSTRAFPNGTSRLANRDLADRLQSQIVGDLRATWRPTWRQRPLWDRPYSEATRPNVPSALLELLSHQNFLDMRYGLDPRFRADAARAVYKAIGRFLAEQRGTPFVVQPLRPTHFAATFEGGTRAAPEAVRLSWRAQPDSLEPSALPDAYLVQTRDGERGWSEGVHVDASASVTLPAPPSGTVRSYRVVALNAGGASRPSTALAVGVSVGGGRPVLVIDGFDRVAAPDVVDEPGRAGFVDPVGVPEGVGVVTVGPQVEFDPATEYATDPEPGWGKSLGTLEGTRILGNDLDHVAAHGEALLAIGRSFVSASDEAVEAGDVRLGDYAVVDLALGLERRTPGPEGTVPPAFEALPATVRDRLGAYLDGGGALLVSGAHWAADALSDPASAAWARRHLGIAAVLPVSADAEAVTWPSGRAAFNRDFGPEAYAVRSVDAFGLAPEARSLLTFEGTEGVAGAVRGRAVSLAVPLESVLSADARARLLVATLGGLPR